MKQKLLKLMCLLCVSVISASAWGDSYTIGWGTASGTDSENYFISLRSK